MLNVLVRAKQCRPAVAAAVLSVMVLFVSGCGSGSSSGGSGPSASSAAGTVTGRIVSLANNAPVSGAAVKTTAGTTTTSADGTFSVPAPVGDRTTVHVEASGFAEGFPIARVTAGQTTTLGVKLVPTGVTTAVSVATGDTVSAPNSSAQVTIPANALVPQAGGTAAGSVNVSVTPINPAVDTSVMPGGFNGISAGGGTTRPIESFGAMLIDIRDSAGSRYTLAPGKTASIRVPLGTQSTNPPTTMPLWFFDETAGVWREEGTATLQQGSGANRYYEGTVTRVSYWNADLVLDTISVNGCVKDANNQPVANALVQTEGIDYTGTAFDSTATDGNFSVAMRKSSQANLRVVEVDPQTFAVVSASNVVKVVPSAKDLALTNCLVKQPGPLTITTTALPGGTVGAVYNQTLAASGGVPGYVWSLNSGSNPLPAGLELNPAGVISGTSTATGTKTITIKVTDSTGSTKTKEFTLEIVGVTPPPPPPQPPALTIATTALPSGTLGTAYNAQLAAAGGTGAKSWSVSSGELPAGLSLNKDSGVISGTPTAGGASTFTVLVQDSGTPQQSTQKQLILAIISTGGGGGGTGGGQLTVTNAPSSVGGSFIGTVSAKTDNGVDWRETGVNHEEAFALFIYNAPGLDYQLIFTFSDVSDNPPIGEWTCVFPAIPTLAFDTCSGVTIDRASGKLSLENTVLSGVIITDREQRITLNGTLTFAPF